MINQTRKSTKSNPDIQPLKGERYSFDDLAKVIAILRAEDGCSWDRVQTHESLKKCVIEEAYEVVEAINDYNNTGNYDNLCEELGDLMLQSMMHAQIAYEEGIFDIGDVIERVTDKMITRHTKIWPEAQPKENQELSWEQLKQIEKARYKLDSSNDNNQTEEQNKKNELENVPLALPALIRMQKIMKKAEKLYGIKKDISVSTNNIYMINERIKENVRDKKNKNYLEDKEDNELLVAQLLLETVNVAKCLDVDAELSLAKAAADYAKECEPKKVTGKK